MWFLREKGRDNGDMHRYNPGFLEKGTLVVDMHDDNTLNLAALEALQTRLGLLWGHFDVPLQQERLEEIRRELEAPESWQDVERSQTLNRERARLEDLLNPLLALQTELDDLKILVPMAQSDGDAAALRAFFDDSVRLAAMLDKLEFQKMFSGEMDRNNAFLEINAGSGGTEAQDWAMMLMRMYARWCEDKGFRMEIQDISYGEVAGIKSVSYFVEGSYAYGWLRTESGVHRLVRKSPFDSGNRRHTSFASVFVSPEISDDIAVEINPADLRIDTYRASGAGGQHVNRTDSAIRITHLPTGIVVQCQSDRSQHKNRAQAFKQLKAKLYEVELQKKNQEKQKLEEGKMSIGWGSQIRSYVLDDARVKDLRTGVESGNPEGVLDGKLDPFIEASLREGL